MRFTNKRNVPIDARVDAREALMLAATYGKFPHANSRNRSPVYKTNVVAEFLASESPELDEIISAVVASSRREMLPL